ncbi:MAG: hypothetical protein MRK01_03145 [Candidatus Scalindua sp.]|nr:hypothetical protein [Candidatus Scalindua sp.]
MKSGRKDHLMPANEMGWGVPGYFICLPGEQPAERFASQAVTEAGTSRVNT